MLFSFAKSHIGQRKVNEDSYLIDEDLGLYIVADGVGGLDKGEVASKLVCDSIHESINSGLGLEDAIYKAHRLVIDEIKQDEGKQGMATTIVAALFYENSYDIAWVGDSRAYLWGNALQLITKDDSYVELLLENGHIEITDLETHPDRNIISQALGIERKRISINSNSGTLEENQILMLCSDGLYTIADELDMIKTVSKSTDVKNISSELVAKAVAKEGKDNITLISIKSNYSLENENAVRTPLVYREFDLSTGNVKELNCKNIQNTIDTLDVALDPELVDRTELKDLTTEEIEIIESALQKSEEDEMQRNKYIFPILLVLLLAIIAWLVLK